MAFTAFQCKKISIPILIISVLACIIIYKVLNNSAGNRLLFPESALTYREIQNGSTKEKLPVFPQISSTYIQNGSINDNIDHDSKSLSKKTAKLPVEKRQEFQNWLVDYLNDKKEYFYDVKPLPLCHHERYLKGSLSISLAPQDFDFIKKENPNVELGGKYKPSDCTPFHERVAIIVPATNRLDHLKILLRHIHPVLQRQQLNYQIFVVEQMGNDIFNKGVSFNAAFQESEKMGDFHCYIFQDVDMLIENDCGFYVCRTNPFHLNELISDRHYENPNHVGGVIAMEKRFFEIVNGYSNLFYGWGNEDDDLANRFRYLGFSVDYSGDMDCYRFTTLKHGKDKLNPVKYNHQTLQMSTKQRMAVDGLNSVTYNADVKLEPLFTHIKINFTYEDPYLKILGEHVFDPFL